MKWPLFENRIKGKLQGHQSDIDVEALWSAIEPDVDAINRKKKRRFTWFWLIFTGIALTGTGLGYFYWHQQEKEQVVIANISKENSGLTKYNTNESLSDQVEKTTKIDDQLPDIQAELTKAAPKEKIKVAKTLSPNTIKNDGEELRTSIKNIPLLDTRVAKQNLERNFEKNSSISPNPEIETLALREVHSFSDQRQHLLPKPIYIKPNLSRAFSFSIGIHSAIGLANKDLSPKGQDFQDLLQMREETESPLEFTQLGIRLQLTHQSGFGIISGLQYTQINELFQYSSSETVTDSIDGIHHFVVNLYNEIDTVYDKVPQVTTTTLTKKYYNKYQLIDIPLLLSYQINAEPYLFGVEAGILANLKFSTKGRIMGTSTQDINLEESEVFGSKLDLSYHIGLTAGYYLQKDCIVYLSPSFRLIPQSMTGNNYELEQRYKLFGLNAGIRYQF